MDEQKKQAEPSAESDESEDAPATAATISTTRPRTPVDEGWPESLDPPSDEKRAAFRGHYHLRRGTNPATQQPRERAAPFPKGFDILRKEDLVYTATPSNTPTDGKNDAELSKMSVVVVKEMGELTLENKEECCAGPNARTSSSAAGAVASVSSTSSSSAGGSSSGAAAFRLAHPSPLWRRASIEQKRALLSAKENNLKRVCIFKRGQFFVVEQQFGYPNQLVRNEVNEWAAAGATTPSTLSTTGTGHSSDTSGAVNADAEDSSDSAESANSAAAVDDDKSTETKEEKQNGN